MPELTPEEVNRRVAEKFGWSGMENADACIAEMFPYPDKHLNGAQLAEATASGWFGWASGAPGPSTAGGFISEGADKEPTPDYCRDPAAGDLVRQEIERRKLPYYEAHDLNMRRASIRLADGTDKRVLIVKHESHTRGYVLCLAFLAATETE